MTLGTKLRHLRLNKNLSQTKLAGELGISQTAYNKWESEQAKPSLENLVKISEFHKIAIQDLLNDNASLNMVNPVFNDSSSVQFYPTINMQPSELAANVLHNQTQITKLLEVQNRLIEALLKK